MFTVTKRIYNDMGDGYEEYVLYQLGDSQQGVIHVGKFYEDMPSSVNVEYMNENGTTKRGIANV